MGAAPSLVAVAPPPGAGQTEQEPAPVKASEQSLGRTTASKASEKASGTEVEAKPPKQNKVFTDQCGLADDEDEWEDWEGPQRIKTSLATPALMAKCRAILEMIFHADSINGVRVIFPPQDVVDIARAVEEYFKSEPMLIDDVPFGITIVGDLHGQLHDFWRVFLSHAKDGRPGYECAKFLFLGNYVDAGTVKTKFRGRQSLEVVMALFCLKILHPDQFILLRGNHELSSCNIEGGLFFELLERFEEATAMTIFWRINESFIYLSVAAIVGDIYFCAHGGFSPRATRDQIKGIKKPIFDHAKDTIVQDLCYAEPAVGLRGTVFNKTSGVSCYFGLDALVHSLHAVQCVTMFRSHTCVNSGIDNQAFLCITVFTATNCNGACNDGACVDITADGTLTVHNLKMDMKRAKRDYEYFEKDRKKRSDKQEEKTMDEEGGAKSGIAAIQDD